MEDGDFLGTRRAQVFFDIGQVRSSQAIALGFVQHGPPILLQSGAFIDAAYGQACRLFDDVIYMGCRIGRRQMDAVAAPSQFHGNGRRNGRLADAALAHGKDDLTALLL